MIRRRGPRKAVDVSWGQFTGGVAILGAVSTLLRYIIRNDVREINAALMREMDAVYMRKDVWERRIMDLEHHFTSRGQR